MNMHVGPVGAVNDIGKDGSILEPGPQFKPKDLETFEADSNTVLNTGSGDALNRHQYAVGIHGKK